MEPEQKVLTQEEILKEILLNSRKTKQYMKWQLYITLVLVVLPLVAFLIIVPMVMKSLIGAYTSGIQ